MHEITKWVIDNYTDKAIAYRRHFHENPELSWNEFNTAAFIREHLINAGYLLKSGISGNSTCVVLDSGNPGPTIGLRADIDALPIEENNNLEYRSKNKGVMHSCGHDVHAATILALSEALAEKRRELKGRVVFFFQQAEEDLPGGAKLMVEEGAANGVDMAFMFHVLSTLEVGKIFVASGSMSCASSAFRIKILGRSGHVNAPQKAINPVPCAVAIVNAIHQIEGKKTDPHEVVSTSVTYINCGKKRALNIIPDEVVIGGNIRTLKDETLQTAIEWIRKYSSSIAEAYDCGADIEIESAYPPVVNDEKAVSFILKAANDMGLENEMQTVSLGGEDFSYFLQDRPGAEVRIGFWNSEDIPTPAPHHSKEFMLDDVNGIPIALGLMCESYLNASENI
ncbi:MAG: amidohydrolase [Spirochaetales bacterium]|nr:amidohydrolase [Spirochaetales bacterium]